MNKMKIELKKIEAELREQGLLAIAGVEPIIQDPLTQSPRA